MIHRHKTLQIQPVRLYGTTHPSCHSEGAQRVEESSQAASFTLCWFIEQRGGFLRSLCSVGTTYVFGFGRYKFKCTTIPAPGGRMAADCRRYTRYIQQTTQCSGDDSSPSNVSKTTCVDKTEPPPDMSFRGSETEPRNLLKRQDLSCVGSSSNVVDSSAPLRYGRNDIRFWVWSLQI